MTDWAKLHQETVDAADWYVQEALKQVVKRQKGDDLTVYINAKYAKMAYREAKLWGPE